VDGEERIVEWLVSATVVSLQRERKKKGERERERRGESAERRGAAAATK